MKKTGFLLLFFIQVTAFGQIDISGFIEASPNYASLRMYIPTQPNTYKEWGIGFTTGVGAELFIKEKFSVALSGQFLQKNINGFVTITDSLGRRVEDIDIKRTFNYINLPLVFSLRTSGGIAIKMGGYFSSLVSQGYTISDNNPFPPPNFTAIPVLETSDYGMIGGLGYYKSLSENFSLEVVLLYHYGLAKVYEYIDNHVSSTNNSYFLKITHINLGVKLNYHFKKKVAEVD